MQPINTGIPTGPTTAPAPRLPRAFGHFILTSAGALNPAHAAALKAAMLDHQQTSPEDFRAYHAASKDAIRALAAHPQRNDIIQAAHADLAPALTAGDANAIRNAVFHHLTRALRGNSSNGNGRGPVLPTPPAGAPTAPEGW